MDLQSRHPSKLSQLYCNIIANMSRQNKLQLFILIFLTVSLLCHFNIHNAIFYNFFVWRTFRLCAVYTIYTVALMIVFRVSLSCGVQWLRQNLLCTSLRHCSFLYTQHEGTDDFCTIFEMFDVCKVLKPPRCCLLVYFDKLR